MCRQELKADEAQSPPLPPTNTVDILERKSGEDEQEEENVFPGSDFLSVADVQVFVCV